MTSKRALLLVVCAGARLRLQTSVQPHPLVLGEPACVLRPIGEPFDGGETEHHRGDPFEQEEPLPPGQPQPSIESQEDTA